MDHTTNILRLITEIEERYQVEVLYAVESGSRAWGFPSEESDYDVRFIYTFIDTRTYLGTSTYPETITYFSNDRLYDFHGWDIKKAFHLLGKHNPSLVEWLHSPIVYLAHEGGMGDFMRGRVSSSFIPRMLDAYKGQNKTFMKKHEKQHELSAKKYMYTIRPALMIAYLHEKGSMSDYTIDMDTVMERTTLPPEVRTELVRLVKMKKNTTKEHELVERIPVVDSWLLDMQALAVMTVEHTHANYNQECKDFLTDRLLSSVQTV